MTSELGVTEHIEGDECKFAVWTGRAPTSDTRVVLRANSMDAKQLWVKRLREVIQETYFSLSMPKSPAKKSSSQRSSRDLEECASLDDSVENLDRNSLASFGSTNTTDSDKVSLYRFSPTSEQANFFFFASTTRHSIFSASALTVIPNKRREERSRDLNRHALLVVLINENWETRKEDLLLSLSIFSQGNRDRRYRRKICGRIGTMTIVELSPANKRFFFDDPLPFGTDQRRCTRVRSRGRSGEVVAARYRGIDF